MSLEFLHLSRADVEAVGMSMTEVVAAVEDVLREKGCGRVEMPPKRGVQSSGAERRTTPGTTSGADRTRLATLAR